MGPLSRLAVSFAFLLVSSLNLFAQSAGRESAYDDTAAGRTTDAATTVRRVPRVIRFNGALRTDGDTRTGSVGLTFAIYGAGQGGAALWVETQNVQLDEQGRYSAILGGARAEGLPVALFATGEARWLGVRMAEEGAAEQPRVMLVSVPYALAAGDAQSLNGRPASDFQLTRAAAAGDAALEGGQAAGLESSAAVGSTANTVGRIAKFTALDTVGDSAITDGGGLIGINNANPQYELDVVGAAVIGLATERFAFRSGSMSFNRNVNTGAIFDGAKHAYQIQHTGSATAAGDNLAFQVYGPSGATIAPDALSISGEGYVGVATTTPILPLDVRGAAVIGLGPERFSFRGSSMAFNRNATNGAIFNPNRHAYQFEQTGSLTAANDNLSIQVYAPNGVNLTPNALAIAGSGNVGVGTSSPSQKLEVAGTVYSTSGGFKFPDATTQTTATTTTNFQARVTGTCTTGQYVQTIAANGTVTCGTDQTGAGGIVYPYSSGNQSTSSGAFKVIQTNSVVLANDPTFAFVQTGIPAAIIGVASNTTNTAVAVAGLSNSPNSPAIVGWNGSTAPGEENDAPGVIGRSDNPTGVGVSGEASSATGINYGVVGEANSTSGTGVKGRARAQTGQAIGVRGESESSTGTGVFGFAQNGGTGGRFESIGGAPLVATAGGTNVFVVGADGITTTNKMVVNNLQGGNAFTVQAGGSNILVVGAGGGLTAASYAQTGGNQNEFNSTRITGTLQVTGNLSKGSGTFKIDHPLDPTNKYLYHSFVESPDMMNIYNGVIKLDARGQAWVTMPDWFEALNMDFRYQLTAMGRPLPNLFIAKEMNGNRFMISGGKPNAKVSWQVTGIRHDAYANAHRIKVEEEKDGKDKGTYLYPESFEKPIVAKK